MRSHVALEIRVTRCLSAAAGTRVSSGRTLLASGLQPVWQLRATAAHILRSARTMCARSVFMGAEIKDADVVECLPNVR